MTIELDVISRAAAALQARGVSALLATVVRVAGSSYRRPGARMLVAEDRWLAGCVSGGCLEGDVMRRGDFRLRSGAPVVVRYDSQGDDDIGWGFGVGCNGVVEILLERLGDGTAGTDDPLAFVRACIADEDVGAMITVFESADAAIPVGARLYLRGSAVTGATLPGAFADAAREAVGAPRPRIVTHARVTALVEPIAPPPHVFVIGSGHDAVPLVTLAHGLGMRVTIADLHTSVSLRERFADADEVLIADPAAVAQAIGRRQSALVALMTHDYDRDRDYLGAILKTRAKYIGVLGPERRTARILAELEQSGVRASDDALSRLHAPAGLDVGAETPREIALAILSEMQATLTKTPGGYLRARDGAIHDSPSEPPPLKLV